MSDDDSRQDAAAGTVGDGFGAQLGAAREAAGLSIGEVAGRLRLHVNQVRALESENFTNLPEAAYVRGFVRSYARLLGLDPAPLVDDLNGKLAPAHDAVVDGMARTQEYSPVRAAAHEQASRWLVLGLALAALIALGLIGWYATRSSESAATAPARTASPAPVPALPANERPVPVTAPVTNAATEVTAAPATAAEPAAADASGADAAAQAPAADVTPALLVLTFRGLSWVEVTDANGAVLVSQLARDGEVLQPTGAAPLAVVVGDAAHVTATVRGAVFDLEPVTRANVARFNVK